MKSIENDVRCTQEITEQGIFQTVEEVESKFYSIIVNERKETFNAIQTGCSTEPQPKRTVARRKTASSQGFQS